ncbi:m7GpppX diphosphatase [Fopius arisanus]|uniref:m7GpppX diphosphatase n=1 Tax=Fopius arisanus TaxID=64838 RepID=A0A0C9QBW7_9HYME|nr:PREDICTED: m7GpppX diphosphatase [Fopius arisanus]
MAESESPKAQTDSPIRKKQKVETTPDKIPRNDSTDDVDEFLKQVPNFQVEKVLRNDIMNKRIALQGLFKGQTETVLVVMEKKIFPEEPEILQGFFDSNTRSKKNYRNDVYRGYDWFPASECNGLNVTITYPATKKHLEKWCAPRYYLIEETPELFEQVTLPRRLAASLSLQWVDNILNGTAELDRVIYNDKDNDTGFVLVKDLKWDDQIQTLYLLAITRQRIPSIRELNATHLPLLKNIKENACKIIEERYHVPRSELKIFFHYQPSFYHLHVHFTSFGVENAGAIIEKGHLLTTVINNIEMVPDYYQKAVLLFRVPKLSAYQPYEDYLEEKKSVNLSRESV